MKQGDRVVVLASEHRGEIHSTSKDGLIYVWRDDLEDDHWAQPSAYEPHELEVCNVG